MIEVAFRISSIASKFERMRGSHRICHSQRTLEGSSHFENTVPIGLFASHTLVASPALIEPSILRWSSECGISSVAAGTEYFESGQRTLEGSSHCGNTVPRGLLASHTLVASLAFAESSILRWSSECGISSAPHQKIHKK
jgi:hypothetical protein